MIHSALPYSLKGIESYGLLSVVLPPPPVPPIPSLPRDSVQLDNQSRFIALTLDKWEGIEASIFRSVGNESIHTQGNFLPWEWQVSDRLILVGYALSIDFLDGLQGRYALLLRKTILFFGQVAQKGELAGLKAWLHVTESGEGGEEIRNLNFDCKIALLFRLSFSSKILR